MKSPRKLTMIKKKIINGKPRHKHSYTFTNLPGSPRKVLLCPDCGEFLIQEDIEQYSACPYCGKSLTFTNDIEDFIITPFIDPWSLSSSRIIPENLMAEED